MSFLQSKPPNLRRKINQIYARTLGEKQARGPRPDEGAVIVTAQTLSKHVISVFNPRFVVRPAWNGARSGGRIVHVLV